MLDVFCVCLWLCVCIFDNTGTYTAKHNHRLLSITATIVCQRISIELQHFRQRILDATQGVLLPFRCSFDLWAFFSLLNFLQPNPDEKKSQYCCNISVRRSSRVTFCPLSLNFTIIRRGCVTTRCAFNNKIQQSGFLYNFFFHTFYHYIYYISEPGKWGEKNYFLCQFRFRISIKWTHWLRNSITVTCSFRIRVVQFASRAGGGGSRRGGGVF